MVDGQQIGSSPLTGHAGSVETVATLEIDGQPAAVTGSEDSTVRVWSLSNSRQIGASLSDEVYGVWGVSAIEIHGRPQVVTGNGYCSVRPCDLTDGVQIGEPLIAHTSDVWAVTIERAWGRPSRVLTVSEDGAIRMWDIPNAREVTVAPGSQVLVGFSNEIALLTLPSSNPLHDQ
ncbi:WD40 repeat domain-containing protein [Streptomyces sp. NPDC060085]|uniref:WD40 repeat domain-containing protein n=1 Tax=Streptomyces sp. NPDC060085 TaxID=3347054 RepID=UPI00365EAA3C